MGKKIERLIWVQFEGRLDNDDQTYNYPTSPTVTLEEKIFTITQQFLNTLPIYKNTPAPMFQEE